MTPDSSRSVRVFVNAVGVDVHAGASALDAVRQWNADEAEKVARGERVITDSRGLPIGSDAPVSAGSIFRLIPVRRSSASSAPTSEGDDIGDA
jgi:hypothetical protein